MKWFRSKEEKQLKTLMTELQQELSKSTQLTVETVREIEELRSKVDKRDKQVASLKDDLGPLKAQHKKLLDYHIEHVEGKIYLQCAKIMEGIRNGGQVAEMDSQAKVLEESKNRHEGLLAQRRALMGIDPFNQRQQAGSALLGGALTGALGSGFGFAGQQGR